MVQRARATSAMNMNDELRVSPKRMQSAGEELANSISHGIGLCAALIGAPILLLEARRSSPGFSRRGDFCGHDVDVVSRINALPCVATNAREIHSAGRGSFGDLFVNRWNIHTVHAGPASRLLWIHHARACLGARDFRRFLKDDSRALASS